MKKLKTISLMIIAAFIFVMATCKDVVSIKKVFIMDDKSGIITEYDTKDFKVVQRYQIPQEIYFEAKKDGRWSHSLQVSSSGRIIFSYTKHDNGTHEGEEYTGFDALTRKLWYWDGKKEHAATVSKKMRWGPYGINDGLTEPVLDSKDAVFYWTFDRIVSFRPRPPNMQSAITVNVELYKGSFQDGKLVEELIAQFPFDECECSTGACSETCPESVLVSQTEGIGDLIEILHFVSGQLESRIEGQTFFERKDGKWAKTGIGKKLEKPFLKSVHDTGCCSWHNESSDQVFVVDGDTETLIYDEWEQFGNRNYDVSFYIDNSELSPDYSKVAYTISSSALITEGDIEPIRLSADGSDHPKELETIKALTANTPMVEVKRADEEDNRITINRAALVGWLDDNRLLILKDGGLGVFDVPTKAYVKSPLKVDSAENVFLR